MIISFGWTTPALLAGQKTVTRRYWNAKHAAKFKAGMQIDAWNTSPRNVKGNPHKVATIRLADDPVLDWSDGVDSREWQAEGFAYLSEHNDDDVVERILHDWRSNPRRLYVVRFEVVEYLKGPLAMTSLLGGTGLENRGEG